MELGRNLVASSPQFPFRSHLRNCCSPSTSVLLLHEQMPPAIASLSTTARYSSIPVLDQDQHNESRSSCLKEDGVFQLKQMLDRRNVVMAPDSSSHERNSNVYPEQNDFELQFLHMPEPWYLRPSLQIKGEYFPSVEESVACTEEVSIVAEADHAVELAREALSASQEAATIAKDSELFESHFDDSYSMSYISRGLTCVPVRRIVRSTRLLERHARRRKVPKKNFEVQENGCSGKLEVRRQYDKEVDPNDPLRLFLWGPETKQLLTAKEESDLIANIQDLMKLQEVRTRLHNQFSREPTLVEWAAAVGVSCQALRVQLRCGSSSREKLIFANFLLVVHIAKQYQGRGLSLQDLLQEGSMGLMTSVEKFKPQLGCRFATYAYWWIRQGIRKALFRHSRTIRLPENVYALLSKVSDAKKLCIQQGIHQPTKEDIAARAGISMERLQALLHSARSPLSIQQPVWTDQDATLQEITADPAIETPDVSVAKQLMRQHVRNLLSVLNPRERKIIRLRFGIEGGKERSLSEIGAHFGLSKERVRQLESRAMYKLKQCLSSQGLTAYADMLV